MIDLESVRDFLAQLKARRVAGQVSREEFLEIREDILGDLTPAERDALKGTPSPRPRGVGPGFGAGIGPARADETRRAATAEVGVVPRVVHVHISTLVGAAVSVSSCLIAHQGS